MPLTSASRSDFCDKPCSLCDAVRKRHNILEGDVIDCGLCDHDPEKRPGEIHLPVSRLHKLPEHLMSAEQKRCLGIPMRRN